MGKQVVAQQDDRTQRIQNAAPRVDDDSAPGLLRRREGLVSVGWVAMGLALFVLALFAQLLFTNRVPANGDILYYFYPYRSLAADALREGSFLLWNPYIFMGAPFLANPQAAVLYPLHWPLSWLTVTQQVFWSAAIHTWILGLGGYALLRVLGLDRWSGFVGALILAGSGFYGGLLGHLNQMNGAAWLPWSLWLVERARQRLPVFTGLSAVSLGQKTGAYLAVILPFAGGLGGLIALMLLAGHTQTVYINLFGLGAWIVGGNLWVAWTAWRSRAGQPVSGAHIDSESSPESAPAAISTRGGWMGVAGPVARMAGLLVLTAIGCVIGALVAGAQLLPSLELSGLGLRSGGLSYAEASSFSLRPLYLGWTLLPSYGWVDLGVVFDTLGYTEYVAYVGLLGLALAVWGVWQGVGAMRAPSHPHSELHRSPQHGMSAAVPTSGLGWAWMMGLFFAGLGLLLALGRWNPLYFLLYQVVPGFDLFRAPARWMMLYTLGMAILGGVGLQWVKAWVQMPGNTGKHSNAGEHSNAGKRGGWGWIGPGVALLLAAELLLAARALPHTQTTAPQAVYDVRTAPAHLLTDPLRSEAGPGSVGRFLSLSDIGFDPGDMDDYRRILAQGNNPAATGGGTLDPAAFNDLVVALKAQEILAPNLAMLRHIPGVDGFDGGTLPLQRYNEFLTLFIPPHALVPDGRLREQLTEIPSSPLLSLLNVDYVITDKVRDLWFEGVYYDRRLGATLGATLGVHTGATADHEAGTSSSLRVDVPHTFSATHVDLIGYLAIDDATPGQRDDEQGSTPADQDLPVAQIPVAQIPVAQIPVAQIEVLADGQVVDQLTLTGGGAPGAHLADGRLGSPMAADSGAMVAFEDVENDRQEYRARLALARPLAPDGLRIELHNADVPLVIRAITLFDQRTGMFVALLPSDRGRFRLVHSGDVKVYEHLDGLPRAYFAQQAVVVSEPRLGLEILARPDFDPRQLAVLESTGNPAVDGELVAAVDALGALQPRGQRWAQIVHYTAETVEIAIASQDARQDGTQGETTTGTPESDGLLVLSDVYYPGWRAYIDGQETPIYRANYLFRGVFVPAEAQQVVFRFEPVSYRRGLWLSGIGLLLMVGLWAIGQARSRWAGRGVRLRSAPDV